MSGAYFDRHDGGGGWGSDIRLKLGISLLPLIFIRQFKSTLTFFIEMRKNEDKLTFKVFSGMSPMARRQQT